MRSVPSRPAEASQRPVGSNDRPLTLPECPASRVLTLLAGTSQTRISLSNPAEARHWPSRLTAKAAISIEWPGRSAGPGGGAAPSGSRPRASSRPPR